MNDIHSDRNNKISHFKSFDVRSFRSVSVALRSSCSDAWAARRSGWVVPVWAVRRAGWDALAWEAGSSVWAPQSGALRRSVWGAPALAVGKSGSVSPVSAGCKRPMAGARKVSPLPRTRPRPGSR